MDRRTKIVATIGPASRDPEVLVRMVEAGMDVARLNFSHGTAELLSDGRGGVGYLLKDRVAEVRDFVDAVRRVAEGGTALDPEAVSQLLGQRDDGPLDELTPRERDVLGLMAEGRTNVAIAETLVVTEGAVEKHVSNIFMKLGLPPSEHDHRRVLAVLTWMRG